MTCNGPFFSIIIPTYNRPARLASCLEAIAGLDYPFNRFEVIIVDDGGNTPLDEVIGSFRDRFSLTLLRQKHAGVAAGRNAGIRRAKGEFLVFTDDDCEPDPNWLRSLAARFEAAGDYIVGGRTVNGLRGNLFATASQALIGYLFSYYNVNPLEAGFLNGSNLAVPADGFHACGGFDETFFLMGAEEREFCDRWLGRGKRMIYAPEVTVRHFHAMTLSSFLRQQYGYGRGAYHFHRLRSGKKGEKIRFEPLIFYFNLIAYPFSAREGWRAPFLSVLLMLSQVANSAGFFIEKFRHSQRTAHRPRTLSD